MTTPDATPTNDSMLAVARAMERNRRKVDDLDSHVRQLAADVTQLAVTFAGRPPTRTPVGDTPDEPGPPEVRSWLLGSDPEQAAADLADLVEWLDRVYLRYPDAFLTPCWLWHPNVIEELWWLRCAHADAYHPQSGSWLRAGDWHDRQRPAATRRVREAIGKCDLSLHTPDRPQGQPPTLAPLAAHAAEVAQAWTVAGARPVPTPEQLREASDWLRQFYRSQR